MNMEKILNIWGKGQILALSALDGQTSSRHGLVFTTAEKEFALLPRWPFNSGKIAFAGAPENLFLASDMLESSGVKAAFVDAFHFLIEAENVSLDLPPGARRPARREAHSHRHKSKFQPGTHPHRPRLDSRGTQALF